jgi:hypothetical protein
LRAVYTAWPAITSAPRSSHPTGSSECLEAFWCYIRFLGAMDDLAMSVGEMYVSYRNVFACDGFLNFHACLLLTFPCLSVCAVSPPLPAPWLLNRCRWKVEFKRWFVVWFLHPTSLRSDFVSGGAPHVICYLTLNVMAFGQWCHVLKPIGFLRIGFGLPFQGGFLTRIFQQFWICIPLFIASFHPSLVGGFADVWEVGAIVCILTFCPNTCSPCLFCSII